MKNAYKGAIAFGIIAILAVSFVAADGLGLGRAFGQLSDEDKAAAKANMDSVRTAIQNNDYDAWAAAMQEQAANLQAQITEENFNTLVEQHNEREEIRTQMQAAREAGDTETLKALQEQYGFGKGMKGNGQGKHMGQENCPMAESSE